MKYRIVQVNGHYRLLRYGEDSGIPNNPSFQFWQQLENCIDVFKEIQELLLKENKAAREENDQTGPWLPVGLTLKIDALVEEFEKV